MKPLKCQRCGAAIDSTDWEFSQKIFGKKASFCVACMREEKKLARVGNETLPFLSFTANFDFILRDFRYNNDVRAGHGAA